MLALRPVPIPLHLSNETTERPLGPVLLARVAVCQLAGGEGFGSRGHMQGSE